jgi:hypothetical protein
MAALNSDLVRAGLALKMSQIKLATRSYIRDRTEQATGTITGYLVGAAFFAAAGLFLIAACFVGALALFRWLEIRYGLFPAFGIIGGILILIAGVCTAVATLSLRRPKREFPSLSSRMRVAIKANPLHPRQGPALRDAASGMLLTPSVSARRSRSQNPPGDSRLMGAGLILVATVLGWAAARHRQQARREFRDAMPDRTELD